MITEENPETGETLVPEINTDNTEDNPETDVMPVPEINDPEIEIDPEENSGDYDPKIKRQDGIMADLIRERTKRKELRGAIAAAEIAKAESDTQLQAMIEAKAATDILIAERDTQIQNLKNQVLEIEIKSLTRAFNLSIHDAERLQKLPIEEMEYWAGKAANARFGNSRSPITNDKDNIKPHGRDLSKETGIPVFRNR